MILEYIVIVIYSVCLLLIFMYALAQLNLLVNYLKYRNKQDNSPKFDFSKSSEIPFVTIQLPVYNELYVMKRLLKNIAEIDYPSNKLEIQVLDDSTDESVEITSQLVKKLQEKGIDIQHIRRSNRQGYKAGNERFYGYANGKGIGKKGQAVMPQLMKKSARFYDSKAKPIKI